MCERNDTPAGEVAGNQVFHRFKKQLAESNYKINCRKCNTNAGYVLLQKKDVFCGDCLVEYCKHKFRATLGKSKLLTPGEKVLVGVSGGTSSVALVDLIKIGLAEDVHRRLRFVPALVHIDESILNPEESCQLRPDLVNYLLQSGLDCYFTSLELCLSESSPNYIQITSDDPDAIELKYEKIKSFLQEGKSRFSSLFLESFNHLHSYTSKHDFIDRLRYLILVKVATRSGFRRIFVGSTASELSISLMSDISMGRGVEIQSEMSFCSDRFPSVTILRPLREFTQKELAFFARYRNLSTLILKLNHSTSTNIPLKSSISKLTETFLNNLAEEFPSTIYTVFKTGNKITSTASSSGQDQESSKNRCFFCWSKLDTEFQRDRDEYSAFDALQLTSALSIGGRLSETINELLPQEEKISSQKFCYSCLRLHTEMSGDHLIKFCILRG